MAGISHIYTTDVGDRAQFITIFKQRVTDIYTQKWNEALHETSKADSYKCYKSLLFPEKYLFIDLPFVFKQALVRFRSSTHDLMIEKGRHIGIDPNYRVCNFCLSYDLHIVETEFHFLIECEAYNDLRRNIIGNLISNHKTMQDFIILISSDEPHIIYKLSKFLYLAYEKRKNFVNIRNT